MVGAMGDPARRLGVVRGTAAGLAVAAVVVALSDPLTPVIRGVFDHVTTMRVLAAVAVVAMCMTAIRLLRHRRAARVSSARIGWTEQIARVPVDVVLGSIVGLAAGAWFAVAQSS